MARRVRDYFPTPYTMNSFPAFVSAASSSFPAARRRVARGFSAFAAACLLSTALIAQDAPVEGAAPNGNAARRGGRGQGGGGFGGGQGRGNFNPEEMQQRLQAQMRELYGVTDDAEWKIISERITAIQELQRTQATAGAGGGLAMLAGAGRGGQGGFGGRGGGGGRGGNPELTALRQAIQDKAPEAEIKARLAALRDSRKASEERLIKAQEDLRALLDVRQEAVAVMSGLLP